MPKRLPEIIRFNTLDRGFLVPETDDPHGTYFPMSTLGVVTLKSGPTTDDLVRAVHAVERRFPQFRLGYRLDYVHSCWRRVPADQLDAYLGGLVGSQSPGAALTDTVSALLQENITPLEQPVQLILSGNNLLLKIHHSFGDGRLLVQLMQYLLLALVDRAAFERLPDLAPHFGLPTWKLILQTPAQAARILIGFVRSFASMYQEYQQDVAGPQSQQVADPIVSGSPMAVTFKVIAPEVMAKLNTLRTTVKPGARISLNTLAQVLIARRFVDLGLTSGPPTYTIPVDLRRYLKTPTDFYPGNVLGQLRFKTTARAIPDLAAECLEIQETVEAKLAGYEPLLSTPGEILTSLSDSTFKKIYRDWLLKSTQTDPRVFILSNLGNLDAGYGPLTTFLDLSNGAHFVGPLMGGPPTLVVLNTMAGQGNLAIIYNPRRFSAAQIDSVAALFEPEGLQQLTKRQPEQGMA